MSAPSPHIPLEANPESFNPLAAALGLDISLFSLHDVFGFDDDLLALLPQPIEAAVLLSPTPQHYDSPKVVEKEKEMERRNPLKGREGIVYFRQTEKLDNHCGTIALLHALANTPSLPLSDGPMKDLFNRCRGLGPEESAQLLLETDINKLHSFASQIGQTPNDDPNSHSHYEALVNYQGQLLSLDGWGHVQPVSHGPIEGDFLHSLAKVVKEMMAETGSIQYTLLVIAPTVL